MIDLIITIKQRRESSTTFPNRAVTNYGSGRYFSQEFKIHMGMRFSPRGLRFSPRGLRFSPRGLRFSREGLRSQVLGLRFRNTPAGVRPHSYIMLAAAISYYFTQIVDVKGIET